jgi:hypothetical protein
MQNDQDAYDNETSADVVYRGGASAQYANLAMKYSPKVLNALQTCGPGWHNSKEIEEQFTIDLPVGEEPKHHYYYLIGLNMLLTAKKIERRIRREGCLSRRFINEYRLTG